ncbi:phosphohydrolase [bacterium endosymbiont of Escarpia laminata]|nr:MAG: phosphohydrolase [bacterium endosymbiont of Escarpia laminata]
MDDIKNFLCLYHANCADGFGAAWAVRHALGNIVDFHPAKYGLPPPDVTDRDLIIVDFSYPCDTLREMAKLAASILVLDHHKTALEDLQPLLEDGIVLGTFDMDKSGAMLAWEHFNPHQAPPALLRHIEDRDLWRFELAGTLEIQAALFSYPYDFQVWDQLMATDTEILRRDGAAISRKHTKDVHELIDAAAYRIIIAGHDVPVLNAPYFHSSEAGHAMGAGEPFAACYYDTEHHRVFSLRSDKDGMDVSEIAAGFGGGGHQHAAGFRLAHDELQRLASC